MVGEGQKVRDGLNIDIHAHFLGRRTLETLRAGYWGSRLVDDGQGGERFIIQGRNPGRLARSFHDPVQRLKDMDATGIDIQAISVIPFLFHYELDPVAGSELARLQNDDLAETTRAFPDRFVGLATLPLPHVEAALVELRRAVNEHGFKGVEIGSHAGEVELDDHRLRPLWVALEELDLFVFLHPYNVAGAERMQAYHLWNLIGNPLDTTLAAARLVFGGVMADFPRLKICLAHTGGYVPWVRGRWEHGYSVRPECAVAIPQRPSSYIDRFYFDTIAHFSPALEYLVSLAGPGRLLLGTDYPFDMADPQPMGTIANLSNLAQADRRQIAGQTAASLLKLV